MGAWGTGLYSSDIACDVSGDYREMLVFHYSHEEAVQRIINDHQLSRDDPYDAAGWFALADCAWKYGHLDEELKQFVISLIDQNIEDEIWTSPKDKEKRKAQLSKLYTKIQNPPEKISKPTAFLPGKCYWNEGSLYAIKMEMGQFTNEYMVILVVNKHMIKNSRFARETDLTPEYDYAVTTYHSVKMPVMSDFQNVLQIYCNKDISEEAIKSKSYKGIIDKYTSLLYVDAYSLQRKEQKLFFKIGEIDSSLLARIQKETMTSFLFGAPHPKAFGLCVFDVLYKQNCFITYKM